MEATTAGAVVGELDSPAEVLAAVRVSRAAEHREAARQLRLAVGWAAMHSADSIQYLRDHTGTGDVTSHRRSPAPPPDQ